MRRRGDSRNGGLDMIEMRSQSSGSSGLIRRSVVSFHNVSYKVSIRHSRNPCKKVHKQILHDISGFFPPGMNAILGPSGCGKTSLLDLLAGRKDRGGLEGRMLVDGQIPPNNFKCLTGYVSQDDIIMGSLTVRENIMFSANLRLRKKMNEKQKQRLVQDVIEELGLTKCADSKVGNEFSRGISGGERKRTNIGMELIISPSFLFLDEPTTGLDASTANAVMASLRGLSTRGRTIIFSIHQPRYSIFEQVDRLLLLAQGHSVYHGPAREALQYFSSIGYECERHNNPPDFFLDVINGDSTAVRVETTDDTNKSQNSNENLNQRFREGDADHRVRFSDDQPAHEPNTADNQLDVKSENGELGAVGGRKGEDFENWDLKTADCAEVDLVMQKDICEQKIPDLQSTDITTRGQTASLEHADKQEKKMKKNAQNNSEAPGESRVLEDTLDSEELKCNSSIAEVISTYFNNDVIQPQPEFKHIISGKLSDTDSEDFSNKNALDVESVVNNFSIEAGGEEIRQEVVADIHNVSSEMKDIINNNSRTVRSKNINRIELNKIESDVEAKLPKQEPESIDRELIEVIEPVEEEREIEILEMYRHRRSIDHCGTGDVQIFVSDDISGLPLSERLAAKYKQSIWSVENEEYLRTVWSHFVESGERQETSGASRRAAAPYATSLVTQLLYLSRRTLQNVVGSPHTVILQFMVMLFFGLVIGFIYYQLDLQFPSGIQNRTGAFFFIIVAQMFGNMSAIEIFLKDRKMFIHENSSGFYRVSAYYISKMCCDVIPMRFLPLVVFAPISYFMMGLRVEASNFFVYFCNLFLTSMSASSLGFLISASVTVSAIGNIVFALVYVTMVIFGGFIANLSTMVPWISWLKYFSIIYYSLNTFYINELQDQEYYVVTSNGTQLPFPEAGNWYLANQGVPFGTDWDLWQNVQALTLITLGFQFFTYVQLRRVHKRS